MAELGELIYNKDYEGFEREVNRLEQKNNK